MPADGFYEWRKINLKTKQPYAYTLSKGQPFAFGGLWDAWKDPTTGDWLQTFAIITTEPNELTAAVHNRMPLILHPRDYDRWLERGVQMQLPVDLLRPYDANEMSAAACNPAVGNVRNNGPKMLVCPSADGEPLSVLNSKWIESKTFNAPAAFVWIAPPPRRHYTENSRSSRSTSSSRPQSRSPPNMSNSESGRPPSLWPY